LLGRGEIYMELNSLYINVHSLLHLAEQVRHFGCLDTCGAFPFENYLQVLKKMVRSGRSPIVQITKHLGEIENTFEINTDELEVDVFTKKPNNAYVLNHCCIASWGLTRIDIATLNVIK
jgi:hypothetical protein